MSEAADDAPDYIKKAARVIEIANMTQEERDMFEQFERAEERYKNTIYAALLEGEERGIKVGEERGVKSKAIAIARNLLGAGMSIVDISRHTGLTEDEIRQIAH